jgi:tetratricopeptide (TPR) repeat protein
LERVGPGAVPVIDAHPLVRRAFEHVAGPAGHRESALTRAGFLRGRPDRRRPATLEEAREAVELFHAHCDAGLWLEADAAFRSLDNPKHRFLAPALERDLLLRFFPEGDFRRPPLWPGFGRWRSLAIALEMLGAFEDALDAYRPTDAALRGDALLALGRLTPLLEVRQMPAPWQTLHQAYRCHALCLAGRVEEAVALARSLVSVDVYEWAHVFECLLRAGRLNLLDPRSVFTPGGGDHRWADLARRRMRADYLRWKEGPSDAIGAEYRALVEEYDRAGLPVERGLGRLGLLAWALGRDRLDEAERLARETVAFLTRAGLPVLAIDAWELLAEVGRRAGRVEEEAAGQAQALRRRHGVAGPRRP